MSTLATVTIVAAIAAAVAAVAAAEHDRMRLALSSETVPGILAHYGTHGCG